jgi:hypothetical protein
MPETSHWGFQHLSFWCSIHYCVNVREWKLESHAAIFRRSSTVWWLFTCDAIQLYFLWLVSTKWKGSSNWFQSVSEFFQRSAFFENPDDANSVCRRLEQGEGIDTNLGRTSFSKVNRKKRREHPPDMSSKEIWKLGSMEIVQATCDVKLW